jgi:murein DD-endopeptidase MepM/ murein hydrolase activator NlpD
VKGRISDPFGPKQSGGQNDGINITVPQGTPIKAAEDGVVAYAGSELKGYGNLVLVRHPNGYVTAYAHASELGVKKGETVKRGQVIGKAGATGNVANPQLHFEVRKGATPVDPMPFLTGG